MSDNHSIPEITAPDDDWPYRKMTKSLIGRIMVIMSLNISGHLIKGK